MAAAEKSQTFLITVSILEGRHYFWNNMDSAVVVKVDNKKRCTAVKHNSDSPFYNEYFVFEFFTTYGKLIDKNIAITVIQPRSLCRKRKILGYFTLDVSTVWSQKHHQFYHKWGILTSPKGDTFLGPRGYIKLDITILSKGQVSNIPFNVINDEIEGNLLLPQGPSNERLKARYMFDVFKCLHLVEKPTNIVSDAPVDSNKTNTSGPTTFVEISFAGVTHPNNRKQYTIPFKLYMTTSTTSQVNFLLFMNDLIMVKTSVKKNTCAPVFNERLTIIDLFPPLCQRIKIEICSGECLRKSVYATKYINLKLISNDKEEGFLPTFGPTNLHMYFSDNLEGYAGTILMSMHTELEDLLNITEPMKSSTLVQPIAAIDELTLFQYEEIFLFATIFEAAPVSKKCCDKPFSFRMTFGSVRVQKDVNGSGEGPPINSTGIQKPKKISKNYYSLQFEEKPCLLIKGKAPSYRKRIYNSNILLRIVRELKLKLKKIESIFENRHDKLKLEEFEDLVVDALDHISSSGKKYIDIVNQYNSEYSTDLDKKRKEMCLKEMGHVVEKVETACTCNRGSKRNTLWKLQKICRRLEALVNDMQDCWPDIFLWMVSGNKKIAYFRIPAREIVYSPIEEESGEFCGTKRTICFYYDQTYSLQHLLPEMVSYNHEISNRKDQTTLTCKMEVMVWLGLDRHKNACLQSIPKGFRLQKDLLLASRNLIAEEKYIFQFKAHIFQGKVSAGFDKTGLADTFVRVVVTDRQSETHTIPSSLNPIWDETLLLRNIVLYGSKSHIKENSCTILVELLDKDECAKTELVGRCLIKPRVILLDDPHSAPPKLEWHLMYRNEEDLGEILAAFEFLEVSGKEEETSAEVEIVTIPEDIKPEMVSYKIEVWFWGVRELGKICCIQINRPRISFYCGENTLYSGTIDNAKKYSNFPDQCKSMDVIIPSQHEYAPPLCLKIYDSRRFGVYAYAGVHITSVLSFLVKPLTAEERASKVSGLDGRPDGSVMSDLSSLSLKSEESNPDGRKYELVKYDKLRDKKAKTGNTSWLMRCIKKLTNTKLKLNSKKSQSSMGTYEPLPQEEADSEEFDWWTKFYASLGDDPPSVNTERNTSQRNKLKIYQSELEFQPEFKGFSDMLKTFEMYRGKRTGDETVDEENITAIFKGNVKIYRWPPENDTNYVIPNGLPLEDGMFQSYPSNLPLNYVMRAYCVRAIGLRPQDLNGKADPYLCLTLNNHKVVKDIEYVINKQVNPVFGRCFEFHGAFPQDHTLKIAVWDHDITTSDDLIGETKIDLENRFYTKHRALCGIAETYEESGYCEWRGQRKPTIVLSDLCKRWRVDTPEYRETSVKVPVGEALSILISASSDRNFDKEVLALVALRRWNEMPVIGFTIVPEHVETRSLYNHSKPGIEQGKIQMWIDIFPTGDLPAPKQVAIHPRKPVAYELRVIIWNTDDISLTEDDFFLGEKKSDIYVKGWLTDHEDPQFTDVHYKSLTGEGNFNWRFVFPFKYLSTENKLVIHRKESIFALDETEFKIPCKLILQVWDNDTFSRDDFLGTLTLELSRMPRGSRVSKKCDLSILEPHAPTINLFKIRRTRGWWPFKCTDRKTGVETLTGKVETELEIVTAEEAEKSPAGLGRNEPQALPPPKRPDVSFSWFKNPFRALKYVVCKVYRWKIIRALFCIILVVLIFVGVYAFPQYTVKKLLGA